MVSAQVALSEKFPTDDMVSIAQSYCQLIESVDQAPPDFLEQLLALLPNLNAAVVALGRETDAGAMCVKADLNARFDLFSQLHQLLGERDSYWMAFDVSCDNQQMTGSLADDLTDIYCELKFGLMLLDDGQANHEAMLNGWRKGFREHWGQHLLDAERHLYDLQTKNQLAL